MVILSNTKKIKKVMRVVLKTAPMKMHKKNKILKLIQPCKDLKSRKTIQKVFLKTTLG